jgi:hypothetical protein
VWRTFYVRRPLFAHFRLTLPSLFRASVSRPLLALSELYGNRMTNEELFRDNKNRRNGWALRQTKITKPERLDRPLLILALAYVLVVGLGLLARDRYRPSLWCSSNDPQQCSVFTIGRMAWFNWLGVWAGVCVKLVGAMQSICLRRTTLS